MTRSFVFAALIGIGLACCLGTAREIGDSAAFVLAALLLCAVAIRSFRPRIASLPILSLAGIPLVCVGVISMALAPMNPIVSGMPLEWGTLISTVLFALAIFCGSLFRKSSHVIVYGACVAGALLSLFVMLVYAHAIPLTLFAFAGDLLPYGLVLGALSGAMLYDASRTSAQQLFAGASALLALFGFVIVFSGAAAFAGIIAALLSALVLAASREISWNTAPLAPIALALTLLVLFALSSRLPLLTLPTAEGLTPGETFTLLASEYTQSPLYAVVGSGPGSFATTWNRFRSPLEAHGIWWNATPPSAGSAASAVAIEYGLVGLSTFLFVAISIGALMARRLLDLTDEPRLSAIVALAIFGVVSWFIAPPSTPLMILSALALGACILPHEMAPLITLSRTASRVLAALAALFALFLLYIGARAAIGAVVYTHAIAEGTSDPEETLVELSFAASVWPDAASLEDLGMQEFNVATALASAQAAQGIAPDQSALTAAIARAGKDLESAVDKDRKNADAWLKRATLLMLERSIGVTGVEQEAATDLEQARELSPTRPDILFDKAVLENLSGDKTAALGDLRAALALKPDYDDALQLYKSLSQ